MFVIIRYKLIQFTLHNSYDAYFMKKVNNKNNNWILAGWHNPLRLDVIF
jgi:lysophospholipid acyltransferase (LPLAT)-like uncharacterized protein